MSEKFYPFSERMGQVEGGFNVFWFKSVIGRECVAHGNPGRRLDDFLDELFC
jgi:hypothetical protein